jgi:hypothetical protein
VRRETGGLVNHLRGAVPPSGMERNAGDHGQDVDGDGRSSMVYQVPLLVKSAGAS